jgi:hypothetical protein
VLKDKSHIPAATFAIAGSIPHGHVWVFWDTWISTTSLRLSYIINPVLREKARSAFWLYFST